MLLVHNIALLENNFQFYSMLLYRIYLSIVVNEAFETSVHEALHLKGFLLFGGVCITLRGVSTMQQFPVFSTVHVHKYV